MKKNLRTLVFTFLFLISYSLSATTIYKKIQPYCMSSIEWEDEDWPNESFDAYLKRCFNYQNNMQAFKKWKTTFHLFDKIALQDTTKKDHNALYDMITAEDINLLCGKKLHDPCIAQNIDRTQTQFGKTYLYGVLSSPTDNIDVLLQRQKITKYLIDNKTLLELLEKNIFAPLAKQENIVLSFWGQDGFLQSSKRCYLSIPLIKNLDERLNNSETILLCHSLWNHQTRLTALALSIGATTLLPLYSFSLLANIQLSEGAWYWADHFQKTGPYLLAALISLFKSNKAAEIGGSLATSFYAAIFSQEQYDWARDNFNLELLLQKKLIVITDFFRTLGQLRKLLTQNPEFVALSPAAQKILETLALIVNNKKVDKLFHLLNSQTFKGKASLFSHKGRVLVAYRLMHELKEIFEPLLPLLGELESYVSCATVYNEFLQQRVTLCFVEFIQEKTPSLQFTEFWNLLINPAHVVPNDIHMGGDLRNNCIITGPNAGGKSALIKAIVTNLLLAQTIGIAAAKTATITPFHSIATYLNIVDDIATGNSLFKAQVLRAQEMVTLAETTPQSKFSFIALDEMFNGTSAKESKAAAYSVAHHLGEIPNCMCILATHFPLLTLLEKNSSTFTNYKVSVELDPEHGIHYPFKVEQGISKQHIALDILKQEGFDSSIIKNAAQLLKHS